MTPAAPNPNPNPNPWGIWRKCAHSNNTLSFEKFTQFIFETKKGIISDSVEWPYIWFTESPRRKMPLVKHQRNQMLVASKCSAKTFNLEMEKSAFLGFWRISTFFQSSLHPFTECLSDKVPELKQFSLFIHFLPKHKYSNRVLTAEMNCCFILHKNVTS